MKNIQGKEEDLRLFDEKGKLVYEFLKISSGFCTERTYDSNRNVLKFKDSDGCWRQYTYDSNGNQLTFKNSDGFWTERTYDYNGNEITYIDSKGVTRGF